MKNLLWLLIILCVFSLSANSEEAEEKVKFGNKPSETELSLVPLSVTVRSINDLRVKEGQKIKIGQILSLKPLDQEAPQGYISKKPQREVQKQREKLEEIRKIVKEENLPEIIIAHEEAKLRDLEFEAEEFRKGAINPKAPKETTYTAPISGTIKRIRSLNGSDGKLNIEILIEQTS